MKVPLGICWFVVVKKEKTHCIVLYCDSHSVVTTHGFCRHLDLVPVKDSTRVVENSVDING